MKHIALSIVTLLTSWYATAQACYYITPDTSIMEYRAPFVRSRDEVTVNRIGGYNDFLGMDTARTRRVTTHFEAGLYYVDSDQRYDVSVGRNIVYSVVEGVDGNVKSLLVWREVGIVTEEEVHADAIKRRDRQMVLAAWLGLSGVTAVVAMLWESQRSMYNKTAWYTVGATLGGALGYLCGSNKRLIDEQYLPDTSRDLLLEHMTGVHDDRAEHITTRNRTYVLEKTLDIEDVSSSTAPHINHFIINKATKYDVQKVRQGNHASQGALAYVLPEDVIEYEERKEELTTMASIKRLFTRSAK